MNLCMYRKKAQLRSDPCPKGQNMHILGKMGLVLLGFIEFGQDVWGFVFNIGGITLNKIEVCQVLYKLEDIEVTQC